MNLLRFAILGLLIYILYRLLIGPRKHRENRAANRQGPGGSGPVQDVLVEDPVCHTYVPQQQALVLRHGGRSLYFCSGKCREEFLNRHKV